MKTEHSVQRTYLVTGAAGFIASKVCELLLRDGHTVVGVDNLNDYYDVRLKLYRLGQLARQAGASEAVVKRYGLDVMGSDFQLSALLPQLPTGRPLQAASGHGSATPSPPLGSVSSQLSVKFDRFTFHQLDIENIAALERVFEESNFSAVFNLAARAGVRASIENPEIYRSTNILGEENVLKCQVKYGVKKHVLASSSSVYAGCPMPFVEDAVLGQGQSPYAETKKAAEALAKEYHLKHGLDVTVLRYFTVFGPAGRPDMAPFRFIKWIDEGTPITLYGDGTQARDFTYVDDIARGTVLAGQLFGGKLAQPKASAAAEAMADKESGRRLGGDGEAKLKAEGFQSESDSGSSSAFSFQPSAFIEGGLRPSFEIINLGGGNNPLTLQGMIAIIETALGKKAKIDQRPPSSADMSATWADITKAKRLLGWSPRISPARGFQLAVAWQVSERRWLKDTKV